MGCCCCSSGGAAKPAEVQKQKTKVHVGPLQLGDDGVLVQPKFNFGIQGGNLHAMIGVDDVRDGLKAEAMAMAMKSYSTSGDSLVELLDNVKNEEPSVKALEELITKVPDIMADVLEKLKIDLNSQAYEFEGVIYIYIGVGVSAGMYLGWLDTSGYNMVGAEGHVATGADLGISIKAGLREDKKSVRTVAYLTNVGFDVIAKLKDS